MKEKPVAGRAQKAPDTISRVIVIDRKPVLLGRGLANRTDPSLFFKEFVVGYRKGDASDVHRKLAERGFLAGYPLTPRFKELGEAGAFCVTEVHSAEDIMQLASALGELT